MRQAIQVKFFGPGARTQSRMQVRAQAGMKYYPYQHNFNLEDNARLAAQKFAEQLNWAGAWHGGYLVDNSFIFVCEPRRDSDPDFCTVMKIV